MESHSHKTIGRHGRSFFFSFLTYQLFLSANEEIAFFVAVTFYDPAPHPTHIRKANTCVLSQNMQFLPLSHRLIYKYKQK